jgi:signal transduction histidine kinase
MIARHVRSAAVRLRTALVGHHLHNRLSARITFLFGLSALLLGLLVSAITYYATRSSIVGQYSTAAQTTALDNAAIIHADLAAKLFGAQIVDNIDSTTSDSSSFLWTARGWSFSGRFNLNPQDLPAGLQRYVTGGTTAEQIFTIPETGLDYIAIGQEITGTSTPSYYYEIFPMSQAQSELQSLLSALLGAVLLTTLIGLLLGRWASQRTLRPLREVSEVARQISEGKLDARIETPSASDLALLSRSFNHMVDLLQERLVREERFTSDVSHELRSPLTTLGTSISVLESDVDEMTPRSRQAIVLLSQEIRRFQRMVGDLLEISRIDAGSADLQLEEVYLYELVRRCLDRTTSLTVPLEVETEVQDWLVLADKRRFERIIANLVENAQRYADGITRVRVTAHSETLAWIAIEDLGPGIAEADRRHIFERFARAATTAGQRGTGGGTGLGLALVTEHIGLHGGSIWVEENEPFGARFVIEIPRHLRDIDDPEDEQ